jgi:hypothetical protein
MKYAVEMGSVAVIYISDLVNIGSGIPKLIKEMTDTQDGDSTSLLYEILHLRLQ